MACVLSYLTTAEVYDAVSSPLSKTWRSTYTVPRDLWRALCLSDPFRAKPLTDEDEDEDEDEDGDTAVPRRSAAARGTRRRHLGRYRELYASFALCDRYLETVRGGSAGAVVVGGEERRGGIAAGAPSSTGYEGDDDDDDDDEDWRDPKRPKRGRSEAGRRAPRPPSPSPSSSPSPSTSRSARCAVRSVVGWMDRFSDVEGMQIKCIEALPPLLRNGGAALASAARRSGVADSVLRAALLFPQSSDLHSSAFHALVHLARPPGAGAGGGTVPPRARVAHEEEEQEQDQERELPELGASAEAVFDASSPLGRRGAAILADSMRRFAHDPKLQAMGCWSMVNLSLVPEHRSALVTAGAVSIAADAMERHGDDIEVQFRAMFALINLVVPRQVPASGGTSCSSPASGWRLRDESAGTVARLVVRAMRAFHASSIVLNRACLVLHNLSLDGRCHETMLRTPDLYGMVEWCMVNHGHDPVLRRSAGGTLQRLQSTLARDGNLRARFLESLKEQRR